MKTSCQLFSILAIAAVLTQSTAALAEPSTPSTTQNPQLIVYVRTDLPNQGAPSLDLLDLERYFVMTLAERRIQNVASVAAGANAQHCGRSR